MAKKVNIVGAGFVGLTLAEVLSKQKSVSKVTVIDASEERIEALKKGEIPISEEGLTLASKKLKYATLMDESEGDIFFVCVGTPNKKGRQMTNFLTNAISSIVKYNKKATIILKSTTLPENVKRLKELIDPVLGHFLTNPEFMAEGKAVADLMNQNQLIVGSDECDKEYASKLMAELFQGTYKELKSVGLVEAMIVKYFLNSYKATKLNFINDFAWYCSEHGFKFSEVMDSINDPVMGEGFDKPGVGFGGSCFPKDTQAMANNINSCAVAYAINAARIRAFATIFANSLRKDNPVILFGGRAFKNGTNDTRESVSIRVADIVLKLKPQSHIYFYDQVPELSDLNLDEVKENASKFDAVIIFNELPELVDIFKDIDKVEVYNTRSFD